MLVMKRLFILIFIFYGCSLTSPLKKGRLISLYHLIEIGKYKDAKVVAEELIEREESSQWANAWYARGYLCQKAYGEGIRKNNPKLYELYPNQLYVTWESFEKARTFDSGERMERQLAPKYVLLANDFQNLGIKQFENEKYNESLRAFEHALQIEQLPFLSLNQDTLLTYNTALAAYESKNWKKAVKYLARLHSMRFSENATHLLFKANLSMGDSNAAERVLFEGIGFYEDHEKLVFLLTEFLFNDNRSDEALAVIQMAISEDPDNARYYYNKGLIYQKTSQYHKAIEAYTESNNIDPDFLMTFANMATCYYNIGVAYEESTLKLSSNQAVKKERARSKNAFKSALFWLDGAIAKQTEDAEVISKLSELYIALGKTDKTKLPVMDNE